MGDTELFLGLAEGEEIKQLTGTMGEHEVVGGTRNEQRVLGLESNARLRHPIPHTDGSCSLIPICAISTGMPVMDLTKRRTGQSPWAILRFPYRSPIAPVRRMQGPDYLIEILETCGVATPDSCTHT